jgi:cytochrome c556
MEKLEEPFDCKKYKALLETISTNDIHVLDLVSQDFMDLP